MSTSNEPTAIQIWTIKVTYGKLDESEEEGDGHDHALKDNFELTRAFYGAPLKICRHHHLQSYISKLLEGGINQAKLDEIRVRLNDPQKALTTKRDLLYDSGSHYPHTKAEVTVDSVCVLSYGNGAK